MVYTFDFIEHKKENGLFITPNDFANFTIVNIQTHIKYIWEIVIFEKRQHNHDFLVKHEFDLSCNFQNEFRKYENPLQTRSA